MPEYFVVANSNAAPFVSDTSYRFVEGEEPKAALSSFVGAYDHPAGLYAAALYGSADEYHKGADPLARFVCAKEALRKEITRDLPSYSMLGIDRYTFEVDGKRFQVSPDAPGVIS